jgi:hypothetical protein
LKRREKSTIEPTKFSMVCSFVSRTFCFNFPFTNALVSLIKRVLGRRRRLYLRKRTNFSASVLLSDLQAKDWSFCIFDFL